MDGEAPREGGGLGEGRAMWIFVLQGCGAVVARAGQENGLALQDLLALHWECWERKLRMPCSPLSSGSVAPGGAAAKSNNFSSRRLCHY